MDNAGEILFFLLAAGLGFVLFIAAREFWSGIRAAKQEYDGRNKDASRNQRSTRPNNPSSEEHAQQQRSEKHREEPPEPPRSLAWHDVLEVSSIAGLDEIRAAYRRLIVLYHPDRVAGLGAELRSLAEARTKDINAAYSLACRLRGGQ